ncbi:conjugative transposon protein TraN [Mucilaginibacter sp. X5P1]|uniref:conjugative transposon protein TraN n=1 Tax=Mucilaginibacter sp. X5P1 TaxID=2723088 RepID=UPI00161968E5|nr:conjugative transposon protein TraN [Mucilaginibacter sp. X5P1]MBB6137659.1 conjugative transposon TraN protein [Mucilaginibacter sp. X5P1]
MKSLIFAIAVTCVTSLNAFAQKVTVPNGLKMTELPVVYLPDSLSLHFISPEPIQYVDISSKDIVGDLPVKNVLRIRYRTDSLKGYCRDAVVTIAGEKFLAQYHIEYSPSNGGAVQSEIEISPSETRPLDIGIGLSQPELKKIAMELFCRRPEQNLEQVKAYDMRARLNHIYAAGDYLFLDISYDNRSKLAYDIDEFRFKIDDRKVTKATTVQSVEIKPEFVLFNAESFAHHYRNIFVFKKFSFPGNKVLQIELNEKQLSGRVVSLSIPYKDVLAADIIPLY